jgi:hypothetical protein
MTRKFFEVRFVGHYPVGAVAVVEALDSDDAWEKFQAKIALDEPALWPQDRKKCIVAQLDFKTNPCYILLNGNY